MSDEQRRANKAGMAKHYIEQHRRRAESEVAAPSGLVICHECGGRHEPSGARSDCIRHWKLRAIDSENELLLNRIYVESLERIRSFPVHSEPIGGAYAMQDIADEALSLNRKCDAAKVSVVGSPTPIADITDHFVFQCNCGYSPMQVKSIKTLPTISDQPNRVDKCTSIYVTCPNCGHGGQRKIYWERPKSVRNSHDQ